MTCIPAAFTDPASLHLDDSRGLIPKGAEITVTVTHEGTGIWQRIYTAAVAVRKADVRRGAIAAYCDATPGANQMLYSATVGWDIPGHPVHVLDEIRRLHAMEQR